MKTKLIYMLANGLLLIGSSLTAAETVPYIMKETELLVNAEAAGKQFGWESKMEGRTLVLCRDQLCVPVNLEKVSHLKRKGDDQIFVDGKTLGKIMGFTLELANEKLILKSKVNLSDEGSAYHSDWPKGRGFELGQTLPDIPLIDLEGNEVRFSDFLGKRYLIYGWASW